MRLSPKLMRALSDYWKRRFGVCPEERVDAEALLAPPSAELLRDKDSIFTVIHNVRSELARIGTKEERREQYSYLRLNVDM